MPDRKPSLKWTARAIEAIAVKTRTDFTDPNTKGLMLRVTPHGAKTWAMLYNRKGDGKKRRFTLGQFPALSLAAARELAEAKKVQIRAGADPAALLSEYKKANTVDELLDLFLEKHPRPDAAWTLECKRIFKKDARPLIGRIKLPDLNRGHVRQVIEAVRDRGATTTVNRTLAAVRRAFSWGVSEDLLAINPALNMATGIGETNKDRTLAIDEIKTFWAELGTAPMGARSRLALRLVLATGQRPCEVCSTRKTDLDLTGLRWTIIAKRAKNRQVHLVPLSTLAVELFEEAIKISGESEFVFPSRPRKGKNLGLTVAQKSHSLCHAMLGALISLGLEKNPATPQDLRRTAATHMARLGVTDRIVGKVLNHGVESRRTITSQVYIHYDYANEKRQALDTWAMELGRIVGLVDPETNVIELRGR